jgi:hypothetical protein
VRGCHPALPKPPFNPLEDCHVDGSVHYSVRYAATPPRPRGLGRMLVIVSRKGQILFPCTAGVSGGKPSLNPAAQQATDSILTNPMLNGHHKVPHQNEAVCRRDQPSRLIDGLEKKRDRCPLISSRDRGDCNPQAGHQSELARGRLRGHKTASRDGWRARIPHQKRERSV